MTIGRTPVIVKKHQASITYKKGYIASLPRKFKRDEVRDYGTIRLTTNEKGAK
jgi:hypothetical protein